jgi:hypothetical protein
VATKYKNSLDRIRQLCHHVDQPVVMQLISAFILSSLDYCNVVLSGRMASATAPLQHVRNAAAVRLVLGFRPPDGITTVTRHFPDRHFPDRQFPDRHFPDRQFPDRHFPDHYFPDRQGQAQPQETTYRRGSAGLLFVWLFAGGWGSREGLDDIPYSHYY